MQTKGYTIIELMMVTVLLGILASLGVSAAGKLKGGAYVAVMESDLAALARAQEIYNAASGGYFTESTSDSDDGPAYTRRIRNLDFTPSPNVRIRIRAKNGGWSARAEHLRRRPDRYFCAIYMGEIKPFKPATEEGVVQCEPKKKRRGRKA